MANLGRAYSIVIDDSALHAHAHVRGYVVLAAQAAVTALFPSTPEKHPLPSEFAEASEPVKTLMADLSRILLQVRKEALEEAANSIRSLR